MAGFLAVQAMAGDADGALAAAIERNLNQQFATLRLDHHLAPLAASDELSQVARAHSEEMLRLDYFAHRDPAGNGPAERVAAADRRFVGLVGENLWGGYYGPECAIPDDAARFATQAIERFLSSPPHRRNLERPDYTHVGFGVAVGGGRIFVTQLFAKVAGYTASDVPVEVRRGDRVDFRLASAIGEEAGFDIRPVVDAIPLAVPFSPGSLRLDMPAGEYRAYFYFRKAGSRTYHIFPGPQFRITDTTD